MATRYLRAYRADEQPAPEKEGEAGPIRFVASTENMARDGKTLNADGWRLDNYAKNPVFLWAHDYTGVRPPIGRTETKVEGKSLITDVVFDQGDPFAVDIERKYRAGFMNAVSVGWDESEDGVHELLDISAVPVPGDPDALIVRQARAYRALADALDSVTQSGPPDPDGEGEAERALQAVWTALQEVKVEVP